MFVGLVWLCSGWFVVLVVVCWYCCVADWIWWGLAFGGGGFCLFVYLSVILVV